MDTTQLALVCMLISVVLMAGVTITLLVLLLHQIRRQNDSLLAKSLKELDKEPATVIHYPVRDHNGERFPEDQVPGELL